jgi:serine protease Do
MRRWAMAAAMAGWLGIGGAWAADPGFVGLQIQGVSPDMAAALGANGKAPGVLVRDVALGGPAALAGFQRGDLISRFGDKDVGSVEQLVEAVRAMTVGQAVTVSVRRNGGSRTLNLVGGEWPAAWKVAHDDVLRIGQPGIVLGALNDKARTRFGLRWGSTGMVVTVVDAELSGGLDLKPGDVVVQVNQEPVWASLHVQTALVAARKAGRKSVLLLVEGADGFRYVLLPIPS